MVNFGILFDKNRDIIRSGVTIPNTYTPPTAKAPKKLGDKKVKVRIPTSTGAQQALVIPETIPRVKIDNASVLPAMFTPGRVGMGIFIPKKVVIEAAIITHPPIR